MTISVGEVGSNFLYKKQIFVYKVATKINVCGQCVDVVMSCVPLHTIGIGAAMDVSVTEIEEGLPGGGGEGGEKDDVILPYGKMWLCTRGSRECVWSVMLLFLSKWESIHIVLRHMLWV